MDFAPAVIAELDGGAPLTMVAGMHVGCFELFAHESHPHHCRSEGQEGWRALGLRNAEALWSASWRAYVGINPNEDIHWVSDPSAKPMDLFIDRKIDAFLAGPPRAQELRARGIGHSLVNSSTDRPWSQYFCCMLMSRTEFVRKYPVATKRVLRAMLKAADLCATDRAGGAIDGRSRLHVALRLHAPSIERITLQSLAGLRSGRHSALVCLAVERSGLHQDRPANSHRRAHGLAFPQRTQARAEGLSNASGPDPTGNGAGGINAGVPRLPKTIRGCR